MTRDLIIVGAGPAGISAALWARSLELEPLVLERADRTGGQLHLIHFALRNVAGSMGLTGAELAARMTPSGPPPFELRLRAEVTSIDPDRAAVHLADGAVLETRALLIAAGARRRRLDAAGAERLTGHGVSYSATRDRARFAGRAMLVVGGGDAAYENALILADAGCPVTLVVRGVPRARREFGERVASQGTIRVRADARVIEVLGEDQVTGARIEGPDGVESVACEGIVVKIGMTPNTEPYRSVLETDRDGYLVVDSALGTRQRRVWAAGDITRPAPSGIPVAWGQGARAAVAIRAALTGPGGQ